ncbi:hypothetical protein [Deinococcus sp.]|uniref:hypothetical protein n=1 Tax=Deinococcus sp. TaxID=47478 RepID=UPI003B5BB25D
MALCGLAFPVLRPLLWLEVGWLGVLAQQAWTGLRRPLPTDYAERDEPQRLYLWCERLTARPRLLRPLLFEGLLLSHLIRRPELGKGQRFGTRQDATTGGMLGMLLFVSGVEGWLSHLLLSRWNDAAAWTWTGLNIAGCVWLLAYGRALAVRPVTLTERWLYLRSGLHWTLSVPRGDVLEAGLLPSQDEAFFNLAIDNPPNVGLTFRRPLTLLGLSGAERTVTVVKLHLDEPRAFLKALESD